jgi:hypothetical protein
VCGVVVEEASRKVEVTCENARLAVYFRFLGADQWGPSYKKVFLLFIFGF